MNSLKNTITDVSESKNCISSFAPASRKCISFFASTPQDFSEIKIDIELEKKSLSFEETSLNLKKSFKSFFYPISPLNQSSIDENILVASTESIFVISKNHKNPIDNPLTFEKLGYDWNNIDSKKIDLNKYEKNKLLTINSAHPDGTIFITDKNHYYLIKEGTKKEIDIFLIPEIENYKNNIFIHEASLEIKEKCKLKNNFIFKRKYNCTMPIEKIAQFAGKDYRFELFNAPENVKIKEINIEFKKTPSKNNLFIFFADVKNKIKSRFTGEKL